MAMLGDCLCHACSGSLDFPVSVAIVTCQVRMLTRLVCATVGQFFWYLLLSASLMTIGATGTADESQSWSPVRFVCSANDNEKSFTANGSWQGVFVDGTQAVFSGCAVNVNFSLNDTDGEALALLVRLYNLTFQPADNRCSYGNLTLEIRALPNVSRRTNICSFEATEALYILASAPIQLYLYMWPSAYYRASFSAAFVVQRLLDFCPLCNTHHRIKQADSLVHTSAPDLAVADSATSSKACFNGSEQRLAAANLVNATYVYATAVPTASRTCWSVWLVFLRFNNTGTSSFIPNAHVELLYVFDNSTRSCNVTEPEPAFTMKLNVEVAVRKVPTLTTAVSASSALIYSCAGLASVASISINTVQTISTSPAEDSQLVSTPMVAVVAGTTVAAVMAVAAVVVVVSLLVIRSRRIKRRHNSHSCSSDHPMTSVSGLTNTGAHTSMSNGHSVDRSGASPRNPPELAAANFETISQSVATTICAGDVDVVMVDNDLYGAFGT